MTEASRNGLDQYLNKMKRRLQTHQIQQQGEDLGHTLPCGPEHGVNVP